MKKCIENPDKVLSEDSIKKIYKRLDDMVMVVIYRIENGNIIVIIAYETSKIKEYLQ